MHGWHGTIQTYDMARLHAESLCFAYSAWYAPFRIRRHHEGTDIYTPRGPAMNRHGVRLY